MTNIALPRERPTPNSGFAAALRHARYILRENTVTGFAFALFVVIVIAALLGPYAVPYDPLASDTAVALKPPRLERAIGVIYRPETERLSHYFYANLAEQFDAVIHFDQSRAVEPLERIATRVDQEVPEAFPTGV